MNEFKDLTGMKFNHLTVIEYAGRKYKSNKRYWLVECDCEDKTRKEVSEANLKNGNTKSCGCLIKNRKNTEQYKSELEEINKKNGTNIRLKDGVEYLGDGIKITHICTCGKEWDVSPNSILVSSSKSCNLCYTFENWCINNNKQDVLNRWDYELNKLKPSEISYGTKAKYYFKCPKGIHKSELKCINSFTNGQEGSIECKACNSFAQWGIDNLGDDFLEKYWDWEKNTINPWEISHSSGKKVCIKCQEKNYHSSYDVFCYSFINGVRCSYCNGNKIHPKDSFAQYLIDTYGENALDLYWDYKKNKNNPYSFKVKSNKKVYIFCQEKNYHDSYPVRCVDFVKGYRCGYCNGSKVHPLDSLGKILESKNLLHLWSDKNKKSPYEYKPYSSKKVYWKCPDKKHDDYKRRISESYDANFGCSECLLLLKESIMATTLKQVLKHEYPNTEWEYDAGFRTSKKWVSKYDIFVPQLDNLLIECQSIYHDNPEKQKIDKLKKQYAIDNGYNYMALDSRDYTPLQAIQLFLPNIKEIPGYVDILRNTLRDWDLKEAQNLLNEGYTYQEVADKVGTTYAAINTSINKGKLIKPNGYRMKRPNLYVKVVCLDKKDNKLLKIYNSLTDAAIDIKNAKSMSSISNVLNKRCKSAYGYKWMYYDEYIKLNNNLNT